MSGPSARTDLTDAFSAKSVAGHSATPVFISL